MRSTASFRGHPIHPALIPFPFAFLTGALVFDVAARLAMRPTWWATGGHLAAAGVITALVAAVPGFVDYLYTVPPKSTGKTRATRHMLVNLTAVVLVAIAWFVRRENVFAPPGVLVISLEAAGVALLAAGGWMGGVLVNRNQIGVDHRYAGAGRWREARVEARPGTPVVVGTPDELKPNQMKLLHVDGRRIVLGRTDNGWVAFDDRCPHRGGSLAGGVMICGTVQCPWHGSQFDLASGTVKAGPADQGINTYRVEQQGSELRLTI